MIHDDIGQVLKRWVVATGAAPGASAAIAAYRNGRWYEATGAAGSHTRADPRPVDADTIYDLASLTKPLVAALAARLFTRAGSGWQTPLGAVLGALGGTASGPLPLAAFASHRAGLEAHLRLGTLVEGPPGDISLWLDRCANARRADCTGPFPAGGYPPLYSDLGYILLGCALSSLGGASLEDLFAREVGGPLGLEVGSARQLERRFAGGFQTRVAATEVVAARGGELSGVVHDENAWELSGRGLAGHAGAFGTARGMLGFATAMLDVLGARSSWLPPAAGAELVAPRAGGALRMGFDGKAEVGSSAGPRFGARAFGHLGFTGTSVWCDPDADITVVLLTNRVSPSRENILIRSVRPDVHGELFGLAAGLYSTI